jgi:hypothetical protein
MSDQKHLDTASNWKPRIKDLKSFTLTAHTGSPETGDPTDQGYCLWGENSQEHKAPGTIECISGSKFECQSDGTWKNLNIPCSG